MSEYEASSRRALIQALTGGFAIAASELLLPDRFSDAEAREGALDGDKGGRRGKDHKGRQRKRNHDNKGDKGKRRDEAPPQSSGLFRSTALKVINLTGKPLDCAFFYRIKTGLDDYGLPIAGTTQTLEAGDSFRYDPDRYRVGVLFRQPDVAGDYFAEVRNISFWYPRGSISWGLDLNPAAGKVGGAFLSEREFSIGRVYEQGGIALERMDDSDARIEWNLYVRVQPR